MELVPLQQWYCDYCQGVIHCASDGWLEWIYDDDYNPYGLKIVHHATTALARPYGDCYHYNAVIARRGDHHLHNFVGPNGLAYLLSWIDPGPNLLPDCKGQDIADMRGFTELMRRLHVAYYKEARLLFRAAQMHNLFGDDPWRVHDPDWLRGLIEYVAERQAG